MKSLVVFVGLFLLADGWNRKVAEANTSLDLLRKLLIGMKRDFNLMIDNDDLDRGKQHFKSKEGFCRTTDEAATRYWLRRTNEKLRIEMNTNVVAGWNYESNITDATKEKMTESNVKFAAFQRKLGEEVGSCKSQTFSDDTSRQLKLLDQIFSPKDPDNVKELEDLKADLTEIYGDAEVEMNGSMLQIEPELTDIMANSRNETELREAWEKWRDVTGTKMKSKYTRLVELQNIGARDNGYASQAEVWLTTDFDEVDGVEEMCDRLWAELKPLYSELQKYVYNKLKDYYKDDITFPADGSIPAHLLGNMWAQEFISIFDLVKPFDIQNENYDDALKENGYTPKTMFEVAEQFYMSLGLPEMTKKFWKNSIIEKPADRSLVCHASAWDFFDDDDFRIKMCTDVTMDYLETVHHEMGHVHYYMAYEDQPVVYRRGANGGFHEAIGDTIALAVRTPKHLCELIGVACPSDDVDPEKADMNYLMKKALLKVAFLPFGLLIDKYRWAVFRGTIKPENYNSEWWKMRKEYQMISPPSPRGEEFFDPGAKYHVAASVPYIRYFISFVVQFQFYEEMCKAAGHGDKPLHQCDFYRSKEAGKLLHDMMELGGSLPWPEALRQITGETEISAGSILRYFQPLRDWMEEENRKF
ncbi:angiotensin-converting enzyme-like [Ylistrum balloti]|uniref:angiotensin-converting enzyme-like n=1 Tax=Ylistrum balloti TaxID=509963 RepID=UPI002905A6D1|nr:angiotensin-converting enzyme-like [Ylistrum balloti]